MTEFRSAVRNLSDHVRGPADGRVFQQMVRYGIVGASGYALALVLYAAELAIGIPPYPAVAVVFVLNGLYNFVGMRAWAFPASGRQASSELRRFVTVAALSLVVNYSTFALLYTVAGLPALLAQALAIIVAVPVGFIANRNWSFASGSGR